MFDQLTNDEINQLTRRLVSGVRKAGKLATDRLSSGASRWDSYRAAADVQDELAELNAEACQVWAGRFVA